MQPHIRSLETALDIKRDINTYFHIRYKMQGSSTPAWLDIFYTSQSATPLYFIECLLNLYILLCDHSIRACFQLDQFVTRRYALSLSKADGSRTQTTTTHSHRLYSACSAGAVSLYYWYILSCLLDWMNHSTITAPISYRILWTNVAQNGKLLCRDTHTHTYQKWGSWRS